MREQIWNHRRLSHWHYASIHALNERMKLTEGCLEAARVDNPKAEIESHAKANFPTQYWVLNQPFEKALLDDTSPDDALIRLEQLVDALQANLLTHRMNAIPEAERPALLTAMKEKAYHLGGAYGNRLWPVVDASVSDDLKGLLAVLCSRKSFLAKHGFLRLRATAKEIFLRPLGSPEDANLFAIYLEWELGFLRSLQPRIQVEVLQPEAPVSPDLRWSLA